MPKATITVKQAAEMLKLKVSYVRTLLDRKVLRDAPRNGSAKRMIYLDSVKGYKPKQYNRAPLTVGNRTHSLEGWAIITGISRECLRQRRLKGLPPKEIIAKRKK